MKGKKIQGFRDRLEECIFATNLDMKVICQRAGITPAGLWQYRFYEVTPSANTIAGLAKALDVSTDYLLGLTDKKEKFW